MKRGSALLIVLGMISFMVISAVAFSALMRYNRLPSSYLRRSSTSRHLAHAALAEAIDMIDAAIGDNPHPGFGNADSQYPRKNGLPAQRNHWRDRCFVGTNELVSADETVSTLTLEGLAYIPPALINEARYFSRHAESARWHDLGYDSGRFAFFALDVSDCFDVNRVPANWARTSSDLGKVSLAYAFENANHTSYTVSPSAWDGFMDNYVDFDDQMEGVPGANAGASKMPLVSLADLNLAAFAKAGSLAEYVSPFCNFIRNGAEFVTDETGPKAEIMRALNVITDGLYPPMAVGAGDGDIMNPEHQPFTRIDTGDTQPNNRTVLQRIRTTGIGKILSNELPPLDFINLYDYLDENDVPTTLALPTTERVPMVCGLQTALKLHVEPQQQTAYNPQNAADQSNTDIAEGTPYTETMTCRLKVQGTGAVTPMWMFPFQRDDGVPTSGYTAETALRVAFLTAAPGLRTKSASALVVQDEAGFTAAGVVNGAICPKVTTASPSFSNVATEEKAIRKQNLTANLNEAGTWFESHPLVTVTKHWTVHYNVNQATGQKTRADTEDESAREVVVNRDFKPLAADGVTDGGLSKDTFFGEGVKVRPYLTIASRVTKNGKTVDLVPASGLDDNKYNQISSDTVLCNIGGGASSQPILSFAGDKEITFSEAAFKSPQAQDIVLQTGGDSGGYITCPDPRWNFAPENFLLTASGTLSESQYLNDLRDNFLDKDGRDCDIFMAVSNQGYLQSISELAMLPRSGVDFGGGNAQTGDAGFTFDKADFETDRTKLANYNLMWRTYRLWAKGKYARDPIYELGVFDGGRGTRVSPYTTSTYATLAALANTPYSWWAASTNYNATGKSAVPDDNAEQFNKKYAFNAMNGNAKFAWEDLKKVAGNLNAAMRANDDGDWIKGWNSQWDDETHDFCGVDFTGDTDDLYDVDRKFLYGYWRDCFAPKQQLFLVFVRAEPMMMGGGAIGQTPPQLGARAVALVWRNPGPGSQTSLAAGSAATKPEYRPGGNSSAGTTQANAPHRTRVLFYRQFD